ncbi:substrate-binding periplasmic protein [Arsukibacterium sp.]|uniref:substrate-binding periplasmic protein n=1 Tax=Arsukibacterium sp. TaxID=1977258 RepID=UPI002FD8918C
MRFCLVLVISLLCLLPRASSEEKIALYLFTEEYPPWNFSLEGKVSGLNTELIQLALTKLNYQGHFEIIPWGRAQLFTQTQSNTCFYSAVRTPEREALYQWVGPLSHEYVQLFSTDPNHPQYSHFFEASKLRIGGQTADAFTDYGVAQGLKIERIAEIPVNLAMLQLNRIDLWLAGSIGGPYIASLNDMRIYPVATSEKAFELWLACNADMSPDIIQKMNTVLENIRVIL